MSKSVRKLVREAYGNADAQRKIVRSMIDVAASLKTSSLQENGGRNTAPERSGGSAAAGGARATSLIALPTSGHDKSAPADDSVPLGAHVGTPSASSEHSTSCYREVMLAEEYDRAAISTQGPLSGVAVSVLDTFDVAGFPTRFGVPSKLLHRVPTEHSALVDWLRRNGACFVGKLSCESPIAWEEGLTTNPASPVCLAVSQHASHYALTTTILGAPAVGAPLFHDIVAFKPTSNSFDTRQHEDAQHPFASCYANVGIVANTLDDVKYLWDVYTGAIQSRNVLQSIQDAERREEVARLQRERPDDALEDALWQVKTSRSDSDALLNRVARNRAEPVLDLAIGFPREWIASYFSGAHGDACRFEEELESLIQRNIQDISKSRRLKVEVIALPVAAIDMDAVLTAHQRMKEYELARALDRVSSSLSGVSTADARVSSAIVPTGSAAASFPQTSMLRTGFLDELPEELVSAIFHGRHVTDEQYASALRLRDTVVRELDNMFRDVDLLCSPIVGEPFVSGHLRSFAASVPFALSGNPLVSAQIHPKMSLQMVGEMGRDTGLLEDATSLLRFMGKGRPPRWWRQKFLGETYHLRMLERASPNVTNPTAHALRASCGSAQGDVVRDARCCRSYVSGVRSAYEPVWIPAMKHTPSRVLDAPGLVDDYYSTCLSWGCNVIGALLGTEALLFDAADPNRFASYKSPISCTSATHSSTTSGAEVPLAHRKASAARLTSITVSAKTDSEALLGSSLGMVELVAVTEGRSEAVSVAAISVDDTDDCLVDPTSPMQTMLAASVVSHSQPLFDMVLRSVAASDATDAHPFLYLVGMASGSVAVLDVRCSQSIVARTKRVSLPPPPPRQAVVGPSSLIPGLGDRILSVSWNSSGSLFAAGTNSSGVSIWSLANMTESLMQVDTHGVFRDHSASRSSVAYEGVGACGYQGSAVRALRFHPSRPFELAYGGGVGDGTLRIVNVGTRTTEYSVATGAQVAGVVYSPCGRHLVSTHGLRKADLPTMLNSGPLTQAHRRSSGSDGGAANSSSGHGTWGGAPDGPCSRQRNCVAVWCRGRPRVTPADVLFETRRVNRVRPSGGSTGRGDPQRRASSSASPNSRQTTSSLVSGGVAAAFSRSSSRESFDSEVSSLDGDDVHDEGDNTNAAVQRAGRSQSSPSRAAFPLQLRQRLDGHTSRPLYLAAPRHGPHLGTIATGAGGPADGTLRNWTVFCIGDTSAHGGRGCRGLSRSICPTIDQAAPEAEREARGSVSPARGPSTSFYSSNLFEELVLR